MITISTKDHFYTEKSKILQALYQINDPELFINIVDLGLVYNIAFSENNITIEMTLSTPHCPLGDAITFGVKNALSFYFPYHTVMVHLVWEPKWTFEMITETGKKLLGIA